MDQRKVDNQVVIGGEGEGGGKVCSMFFSLLHGNSKVT